MHIERDFIEDRLLHVMQVFPHVRDVYEATTSSEGHTSEALREQIIAYAMDSDLEVFGDTPDILQTYITKVVNASHKITDSDIENLKQAGYSKDFIYEVTVTASLGAGLRRYEAGINANYAWGIELCG